MTSWRQLQLGSQPCKQDQIIYDLFQNCTVNYQGPDQEFAATLNTDSSSKHLILCVNQSLWLSELLDQVDLTLSQDWQSFYVSVNRYEIKGNNTDLTFKHDTAGKNIVELLIAVANRHGYTVMQQGYFDKDFGQLQNFVQPLTWIYGQK